MIVLITLTTAGSDTGPFNIYSNSNGFSTIIISDVSRASLVAGYNATVPDGTTEVLVRSTGACQRDLYLDVSGAPATTTSTTSSTTSSSTTLVPPVECYGYEVCADDGSGDREAYPFTYASCAGTVIESSVVNTRCREICAARNSVDSTSGFVSITEIGPCL
jgi:hypothetical protein